MKLKEPFINYRIVDRTFLLLSWVYSCILFKYYCSCISCINNEKENFKNYIFINYIDFKVFNDVFVTC